MAETQSRRGKNVLFVVLPLLLLLSPLGYVVLSAVLTPEAAPASGFLERPGPEHENCVKETAYMRFHHWELLRSVREEVVRYGERGELGLKRCRECHKSRERFCDRCHGAVSLYPDCWGCHYYP